MKNIFIFWFLVGSEASGQCPPRWTEEWTRNFGRYLVNVFDLTVSNRKKF